MPLIVCAGHTSGFETGQTTLRCVVLTHHKSLSARKLLLILTLGTTVFSQRAARTVTHTYKIITHTYSMRWQLYSGTSEPICWHEKRATMGRKPQKTGSNVCPKPTRPLAVLKPLRVSVKQLAREEADTMCATVPSI